MLNIEEPKKSKPPFFVRAILMAAMVFLFIIAGNYVMNHLDGDEPLAGADTPAVADNSKPPAESGRSPSLPGNVGRGYALAAAESYITQVRAAVNIPGGTTGDAYNAYMGVVCTAAHDLLEPPALFPDPYTPSGQTFLQVVLATNGDLMDALRSRAEDPDAVGSFLLGKATSYVMDNEPLCP